MSEERRAREEILGCREKMAREDILGCGERRAREEILGCGESSTCVGTSSSEPKKFTGLSNSCSVCKSSSGRGGK